MVIIDQSNSNLVTNTLTIIYEAFDHLFFPQDLVSDSKYLITNSKNKTSVCILYAHLNSDFLLWEDSSPNWESCELPVGAGGRVVGCFSLSKLCEADISSNYLYKVATLQKGSKRAIPDPSRNYSQVMNLKVNQMKSIPAHYEVIIYWSNKS